MEKLHVQPSEALLGLESYHASPGSAEKVLGTVAIKSEQKKSLILEGEELDNLEYSILTGHYKKNGEFKTDGELHTQYLMLTDKLIGVIDGSLENTEPYDAVIFLDKSARPVSWLVREFWNQLARKRGTKYSDNDVPKMPEMYFLNIDREQWLPTVDPDRTGNINIDSIRPEVLRGLRQIFQENGSDIDMATILDGKRVLIVDEVSVSGDTLRIAKAMLSKVIPKAEFGKTHWMTPEIITSGGSKMNNDVPVWYKDHDHTGRGVGNRDTNKSRSSNSLKQRIGQYFLSTRFNEIDKNSIRLRNEIKKLHRDVLNGKIIFRPAPLRDTDDFIERQEALSKKAA